MSESERQICNVHRQRFSLKIKQTHCHCLATTHPAGQTSRLSFIQRHPPLRDSRSKRHTHIQLPGGERERGQGSCIIHPWKQSQQPDPERRHADCRSTCDYISLADSGVMDGVQLSKNIPEQKSPLRLKTRSSQPLNPLKTAAVRAATTGRKPTPPHAKTHVSAKIHWLRKEGSGGSLIT